MVFFIQLFCENDSPYAANDCIESILYFLVYCNKHILFGANKIENNFDHSILDI